MSSDNVLRVGHSPDPDDAFMFYGIRSGNVDTQGYEVQDVIEDIETLNQRARNGDLEISAISLHCYAYVSDRYWILPCGVSMGDDYGPILVSKENLSLDEVKKKKIAAPGPLTTAALVCNIIFPEAELVYLPFDRIQSAVAKGEVETGILIHEGQLTYSHEKLVKLLDFGKWWKEKKGLPLPLGIDVVRRDFPIEKIRAIEKILTDSIQYALDHREEALEYALQYGRGLSHELADRFVGMYVNHYTVNYGDEGRGAVRKLLDEAYQLHLIPHPPSVTFSDEINVTNENFLLQ